jgi:hypothetical protein
MKSHSSAESASAVALETEAGFDPETFQHNLPHQYRSVLSEFQKISRSFVRFNILFLGAIGAQSGVLFVFLPFFSESSLLGFSLSVLFLTGFCYAVLLFYYQTKKPESLRNLLNRFTASCRVSIGLPVGMAQHHLSIADTLIKLSAYLQDYEWHMGQAARWFSPFRKILSRISAYCHWHDVFRFKQMLLYTAIDEHLQQIRITPTDLEVHASLANAYVLLSQIYKEPRGIDSTHPRQSLYRKWETRFKEKFETAAKLALEEFRILSQYAPQDPWVHEQLASGYRELEMPAEEILEVETLLKLKPNDRALQWRLGLLYFQQGLNSKGLQIYDALKKAHYNRAEELIAAYGFNSDSKQQITPIHL